MPAVSNVVRVIDLAVAGLHPPEVQKLHIRVARKALADHLAKLDHEPHVLTIVDGRKNAVEESVKAFGVIRYEFQRMAEVAAFALKTAVALSPRRSGRYARSWFIMASGREVAPDHVPEGVELVLVNDQPYARKIQVGAMRGLSVPPGIVERVRQAVFKEFGRTVEADIRFLELKGGYRLKRGGGRKGRRRGDPLTYPALVMRPA